MIGLRGIKNLNLNFNGSYIISDEKFSEDELKLRSLGLREGETLGDSRPLQGQSPYLINAGLDYNNQQKEFEEAYILTYKEKL